MATTAEGHTPAHLWIVATLATLLNAFGCYDYTMTRMRDTAYIAKSMPGVDPNVALAWVDSMPVYAQIGWGLGVWFGLLGSLLLFLRSRWAVWSLIVSLVGAILSLGYQIALAPPMPGAAGSGAMKLIPVVILLITVFFAWYALTMQKKGVLR